MSGLTAEQRYVVREIIPRAVLLTVTFKWLLPLTTLFSFGGNLLEAAAYAMAFTGMFWFFGAFIAGLPSVQRYLDQNAERCFMRMLSIVLVVGIPAAAIALASLPFPVIFSMHSPWAPLVGTIVLNLACFATHDWRGGEQTRKTSS